MQNFPVWTDASPRPDHSRVSVPEESSEDPPTVTSTPECASPSPGGCLSTEGLFKPSSKEAQAEMIGSGDERIESRRSDIREELGREISSKSEDQQSEHLLELEKEDRLDSQEKLSTSKQVSSPVGEEHHYSPSASLEQDGQFKTNEAVEAVTSNTTHSSTSHSAEVDIKISQSSSRSSSSGHSLLLTSKKEAPIKDAEASSPIADGYHDDFESSVYSSPREKRNGSKPDSHLSALCTETKDLRKDSPSRGTTFDSQDEEVEEEIAEELSHHSGTSETSHRSGRLLDLGDRTEESKREHEDIDNSLHSPPISPLQTPRSPVIDEMLGFNIGDRVLVGGVQPGTLRFKGPTSFANGFWAGVELDKSEGSNNGTYDGVAYFVCEESHGIFAPPDKITHLPDKFEVYTDTTEDDDSFFDDLPEKDGDKHKTDENKSQKGGHLKSSDEQTPFKTYGSVDPFHKSGSQLLSQQFSESKHPISNGDTRNIILDFEDAPNDLLTSDMDKIGLGKRGQKEVIPLDEKDDVDSQHHFTAEDLTTDVRTDKEEQKDNVLLDTVTDRFVRNFVKDTVEHLAEIKKAKEQKIEAANRMSEDLFGEHVEEQEGFSSVEQKDGLPFFLPAEQEELSSPELCNRPVSV